MQVYALNRKEKKIIVELKNDIFKQCRELEDFLLRRKRLRDAIDDEKITIKKPPKNTSSRDELTVKQRNNKTGEDDQSIDTHDEIAFISDISDIEGDLDFIDDSRDIEPGVSETVDMERHNYKECANDSLYSARGKDVPDDFDQWDINTQEEYIKDRSKSHRDLLLDSSNVQETQIGAVAMGNTTIAYAMENYNQQTDADPLNMSIAELRYILSTITIIHQHTHQIERRLYSLENEALTIIQKYASKNSETTQIVNTRKKKIRGQTKNREVVDLFNDTSGSKIDDGTDDLSRVDLSIGVGPDRSIRGTAIFSMLDI